MSTETGWTDEFPETEETFYWLRHKQNHADINVGLLRDRALLLAEGTTHGNVHFGSCAQAIAEDIEKGAA